jgi:glycosyltransferase involved in cell wall biosynthesis
MTVIRYGFDPGAFRPDAAAGRALRRQLAVPEEAPVVGIAGRFDVFKDYPTFFAAAAALRRRLPGAFFLACGEGVTESNAELLALVREPGLRERCRLLGRFSEMPKFYAALDVATLTSVSEGFPNVVGEAMACGRPCVVTDVGDCADMVGETGLAVPARRPEALAEGWEKLLSLPAPERARLGAAARARVETEFSLPRMAGLYGRLYESLAKSR